MINFPTFQTKLSLNVFLLAALSLSVFARNNELPPISYNPPAAKKELEVDFSKGVTTFSDGNLISWRLRKRNQSLSGFWLLGHAFSSNGKIIFLEKAGSDSGPFGTRIVTYNYSRKEFSPIIKLKKHVVKSPLVTPNGEILFALVEPQKIFRQKKCIIAVDLKSGDIIAQSEPVDNISSMAFSKNKLYVSFNNSHNIGVYNKSLVSKPSKISTNLPGALLQGGRSILFAISKNECTVINSKSQKTLKKYDLKLNSKPVRCLLAKEGNIFIQTELGTLVKANASFSENLAQGVSVPFELAGQEKSLFFYNSRKKRIFYRKDNQNLRGCAPDRLKPYTKSKLQWFRIITASPFKGIFFFANGSLAIVERKKKRYSKRILIQPCNR